MSQSTSTVEIQVVLEYQWTSSRDLISNVQAKQVLSEVALQSQVKDGPAESSQRITNEVTLRSIIESLAVKGLDIEPEHRISFQDPAKSLYVFIGKAADQAMLESFTLPASAFSHGDDGPVLTLLLRQAGQLSGQKQSTEADGQKKPSEAPAQIVANSPLQLSQILEDAERTMTEDLEQTQKQEVELVKLSAAAGGSASKASKASPTAAANKTPSFMDAIDLKRTKERQIRFVVERVSLWRKLYNGVELGNGETVRYSLEDSARLVGISKKSLDDYLLQLRFGRMYGFDFLKHQCDNIGVLRKFVREHKQKQKRASQKNSKEEAAASTQQQEEKDQSAGEQSPTAKGRQPEIIDQGMVDESSRDNSQCLY